MTDACDGISVARERISQEARARTGFLDLGQLGLSKLPAELFGLTHLRMLNLGSPRIWDSAVFDFAPNRLDALFRRLVISFPDIEELSVFGAVLATLEGISALSGLQRLNCSATEISDL